MPKYADNKALSFWSIFVLHTNVLYRLGDAFHFLYLALVLESREIGMFCVVREVWVTEAKTVAKICVNHNSVPVKHPV